MKTFDMAVTGAALIGVVFSVADVTVAQQRVLTAKGADLVPVASRMQQGTLSVRNAGAAAAGPFVVTVHCNKQGGGGCAESPDMAAYENPAYPGRAVVQVPGLAAGKVFNHKLRFWDALAWGPGNYNFVVEADAGKTVAETNEGNNFGGTTLTKP
jgi:hypothetical protein